MSLLELQRKMAAAVMRPLAADYGMRRRTADGRSVADEAASFIKPNDRLSSFERLEIYNRQYWFRLLSAFSEDFPALSVILGEKRFDALAVAYLAENPSRSFTLRNLGRQLESWLRANPAWLGKRYDVAIDVVRLEWAHIEAFDGAERLPLRTADIAAMSETSRIYLQPYLRLLDLKYPVDNFVVRIHHDQADSDPASNAVAEPKNVQTAKRLPVIRARQTHLAVHRFEESVFYKRIDAEAYLLLQAIDRGFQLGDALSAAFEASAIPETDRPAHIQAWFQNWSELGWLCGGSPGPTRQRKS